MKVHIKTAHGKYLSAQPDGRFEVRERAGAWEEFDVDGLEDATPVDPPAGDVPPYTPSPSATYVGQIKGWLQARGEDLSGPCGAFRITQYVAWGLRGTGMGLLEKASGNQCVLNGVGYATDILCRQNGDIVDILGDGGGANMPTWRVVENEVDPDRWRAPVQP